MGNDAVSRGIRLLERRVLTRFQLERRLQEEGFGLADAGAAAARLVELLVLDDRSYARDLLKLGLDRGHSRDRIRRRMRASGLDTSTIEEALSEAGSPDSERALGEAERKASSLKGLPRARAVRRLAGHLMRRGYAEEIVASAVAQVLPAYESDSD